MVNFPVGPVTPEFRLLVEYTQYLRQTWGLDLYDSEYNTLADPVVVAEFLREKGLM